MCQVEELQKEVERLRGETTQQQETIRQLSDKTTDIGTVTAELGEQRALVDTLQRQLADQEVDLQAARGAEQQAQQERGEEMRAIKIELYVYILPQDYR